VLIKRCSEYCHSFERFGTNQQEKKPLPAITICPIAGFKQSGFHYKVDDIVSNTTALQDIVHNQTYTGINSSIYKEPLGQQFGRCFSYYSNEEIELNSGKQFYFKTEYDVRIFFHQKGDELWFTGFYEFPYEVSSVTLDITKRQNISLVTISLREVWSIMYSKPEMPCKDYNADSGSEHELFANCSKDALWKMIQASFTCSIPDMKQMIPENSSLPECLHREEATNAYSDFIYLMQNAKALLSQHGCPFLADIYLIN